MRYFLIVFLFLFTSCNINNINNPSDTENSTTKSQNPINITIPNITGIRNIDINGDNIAVAGLYQNSMTLAITDTKGKILKQYKGTANLFINDIKFNITIDKSFFTQQNMRKGMSLEFPKK